MAEVLDETLAQSQLTKELVEAIRSGDYSRLPDPLPDCLRQLKASFSSQPIGGKLRAGIMSVMTPHDPPLRVGDRVCRTGSTRKWPATVTKIGLPLHGMGVEVLWDFDPVHPELPQEERDLQSQFERL